MSDAGRLIADRYRLTEHLGSGAMGTVWQAHDERLHRTVAVKRLMVQPGLSQVEANEARGRAMREGRIAARLQHPNAVTVYDVVEDAGQPVLIMEYVPSRSLATILASHGPLPPVEAARIGAQVALGLSAAHAAGIVHRDIKPGNVLLANDGVVKITDFGISRATGDVTVTATGMLAGTPAYLAPEVAKGEPPGPPSDVFSLASTLYAAVEGTPPFGTGDNALAVLHAVAACRVAPPQHAGPLTALLMRMLRAKPDERPTMVEVSRALSAIAAGQPPHLVGQGLAVPAPADRPPAAPTRLDARPMEGFPEPERTFHAMAPDYPSAAVKSGFPWRKAVLTTLAILAAATVGILVASAFTNTSDNGAPPVITSSAVPPPITTSTTTTPAPTTTDTPTFSDMRSQVELYYSLIPSNTAQAWLMLSPAEQAKSGGYANYQAFCSTIASAQVVGVSPDSADSVITIITFTTAAGKTSTDTYIIQFVQQNGQLLINDATQYGKQNTN